MNEKLHSTIQRSFGDLARSGFQICLDPRQEVLHARVDAGFALSALRVAERNQPDQGPRVVLTRAIDQWASGVAAAGVGIRCSGANHSLVDRSFPETRN